MKRYAVIAATDEYMHISPGTSFCHNDAKLLSETLSGVCDFAEQDIVLHLLSPKADMPPSELLTSITSVANRVVAGDTVVFYYAGHGAVYDDEPYLVLPHTDPYNLTQTALALRDISEKLRVSECVNVRIFDVCHSGYDVRDANELINGQAFVRALTTERAAGWLTFAACRQDEFSHSDPTLQHGVFTYYISDVLRSFPEDTNVFPELLKIRVCEKVANWCQEAQRVQTPTFNAAISGNLVMARTRKRPPPETQDNSARPANETEVTEREPGILKRLSRIRSSIRPGTEEHRLKLEEYVHHVKDAVEGSIGSVQSHGCAVSVTAVLPADDIAPVFKRPVARFVDRERLQSLHDIRVTEERQDFGGLAGAAYLFGRPSVIYKYEVGQTTSWPKSYIRMDVATDGFLPSAAMFFYVIPLQIKVCVLRGIGTSPDPTTGVNTFEQTSLEQLFLDLNDADAFAKIDTFVKNSMSAFGELFGKRVESRLDYLESELNR